MQSLTARLERLEATAGATAPTVLLRYVHGDEGNLITRLADAFVWNREDGESVEAFRRRAQSAEHPPHIRFVVLRESYAPESEA